MLYFSLAKDFTALVFGKFHRVRKVSLTCPACGHGQEEPALVISSFCRACGEHFRVRKGIAIEHPGLKVSGIAEIRPDKPKITGPAAPSIDGEKKTAGSSAHETWFVNAEDKERGPHALARPEKEEVVENVGISAGAFFGLLSEEATKALLNDDDLVEPAIGGRADRRDSLARGSMAALIQSNGPSVVTEKDRLPPNYVDPDSPRRSGDLFPGNGVRCYRCYHTQIVSRFARSTQCERCSAYISLANYEIKSVKCHTLRTRGNVSIAKRGGLINGSEIASHHLTVSGAIDATVDCSGEAIFRHSGVVRGKLFCERLIIGKKCEVRFPDGVMTERAEINGHLIGDVTCSGKVLITRTGILEGNLTAVDLETREGGRVSGKTVIDAGTKTELPLKKGFNPTIIG